MTPRETAIRFVECFCSGDVDGVEAVLSPSLTFRGPFFNFDNRQGYIDSLRRDPPQPAQYQILSITEDDTHVAIFYDYIKADRTITIGQLCQFDERKQLAKIFLVFDGRG